MKLYELTGAYLDLMDREEELDVDAFRDTLESIQESIEEKAENTAVIIKRFTAEAKAIKEEEDRLAARRKALENKTKYIKIYLQEQFERIGINKIKRPMFTISLQNNPPSVEITDPKKLSAEFLIQQDPKIDKKGILARINAGDEIEGAAIKQSRSIRIR